MRAFVALPLPKAACDALERLQEAVPAGRLMPPENMHLTLAFLGEQPVAALETLHGELQRIAAPALSLRISGLGVFGGRFPRILYAAAAPDQALSRLRSKVRGAARAAGIALSRERFRPHVTLARFPARMERADIGRTGAFLAAVGDFAIEEVRIGHFALFRSVLGPGGARHDVLAEYPLGGAGAQA